MSLSSCVVVASVLLLAASTFAKDSKLKNLSINPTLPATPKSNRKITPPPIRVNGSVCYRYVGCFNSYPPFDNTGGVLPDPPERVGTVFLLYTPTSKSIGQQLDYKDKGVSLAKTDFNPLYPTKFVIHGFTQDEREIWLHKMKDALLTTGPMNVVIVGWGPGAALPDYPKAVANTRILGKQIELLIRLMMKKGMELSRIHLIGHSLGAHISGYAGAAFKGQLGRISGMDPAGPFYEGKDNTVRLNPSNAKFVDVLHSNAKPLTSAGAGMFAASGHVDFYPNGGKTQPGCPNVVGSVLGDILGLNWADAGYVVSCSHSRSHYYYIESILLQGCTFLSHPCSSWKDYEAGKCATCGERGCSEMGYHSIEYAARGTFYLLTKGYKTASAPDGKQFCGSTYDVEISSTTGPQNIKGSIKLHIEGSKSSFDASFQGEGDTLGENAKIVIVDWTPFGDFKSVTLTYKKNGGWFGFIGSGTDEWFLDYIVISQEKKRYKFCNKDSPIKIQSEVPVTIPLCTQ